MSQEVITDPVPGVAAGARRSGAPREGVGLAVDADLDLAPTPPPPPATGPLRRRLPGRWVRRSITPLTLVSTVVAALGLGVLAGGSQARNDDRDQLLAGTRVLLWTEDGGLNSYPDGYTSEDPYPGGGGADRPDLVAVLTSTGSPVNVERIELGVGDGTPQAPLALRPGGRQAATLRLRPDCETLGSSGVQPTAFRSARAVVRVPGSSSTHRVPLDVLGDPSTVVVSMLAGCSIGDYALQSAQTGPPAVVVSAMSATPGGRLAFTVTAPAGLLGRFELALAQPAGDRIRVHGTGRPGAALPLTGGQAVRVSVQLTARCAGAALPTTYGVLQPQVHARRTSNALPVEGWDDGVAAAAVTAAAVRACTRSGAE